MASSSVEREPSVRLDCPYQVCVQFSDDADDACSSRRLLKSSFHLFLQHLVHSKSTPLHTHSPIPGPLHATTILFLFCVALIHSTCLGPAEAVLVRATIDRLSLIWTRSPHLSRS